MMKAKQSRIWSLVYLLSLILAPANPAWAADPAGLVLPVVRHEILSADSGSLLWNTFLGGSGYDWGSDLAIDGRGNVYLSGESYAAWGIPITGFAGVSDTFVARFGRAGKFSSAGAQDGCVLGRPNGLCASSLCAEPYGQASAVL